MICLNSRHIIRDMDGKDMDLRMKGATFCRSTSLILQKLQPRDRHLSRLRLSTGGSNGQGTPGVGHFSGEAEL